MNLRDFLSVMTKLKENVFKNNNILLNTLEYFLNTQFYYYNQNKGFVNRMDLSAGNYRIGIRMKNDDGTWLRGYCIKLTKMKAMSLCLF